MPEMTEDAIRLSNDYGGVWGEHPNYSVSAWALEVENDDTRLGYWEWVLSQIALEQYE